MAKYRALAALYVGSRLLSPGDVFASEDVPGTQWQPLDDDGKPIVKPAVKPAAKTVAKAADNPTAKPEEAKAADKKDV
jgi:hypothetical protein